MKSKNVPGKYCDGLFFFLMYFIYLSLDALDLCCWAQVFSSCSGQGFLLAVHMPHFAEHGL